MKRILVGLFAGALIAVGAPACDGGGGGGCPGAIIPACTSAYMDQCPDCPSGDPGWCVGYGFEPDRCCGCGDPP